MQRRDANEIHEIMMTMPGWERYSEGGGKLDFRCTENSADTSVLRNNRLPTSATGVSVGNSIGYVKAFRRSRAA